MPQKALSITLIIFAVIIGSLFGGAYFLSRDTGQTATETLAEFFPFGGDAPAETDVPRGDQTPGEFDGEEEEEETGEPTGEREQTGRLIQIAQAAVSGATIISPNTDESPRVRYGERSTGHVFDYNLETGEQTRITNTTIPAIQELYWGEDGDALIARYINERGSIQNFNAEIEAAEVATTTGEATGPGTLEGDFFGQTVAALAVSPSGEDIFYLSETGDTVVGIIASFDNSGARQIFSFPFTEWNAAWNSPQTITLTTKPTEGVPGHAFTLNTQNGAFQLLLEGIEGLTTLPAPDGERVLYSQSSADTHDMFIYNTTDGTTQTVSLKTIPEKCTWGRTNERMLYCGVPETISGGDIPETWYQGGISFSDTLWRINTETGALSILAEPQQEAQEEIDVVNPVLSEDDEYLIFQNKRDGTLWSLELTN